MVKFDPRMRLERTLRKVVYWRRPDVRWDPISAVDTYLSTPATSDDRGESTRGEISSHIWWRVERSLATVVWQISVAGLVASPLFGLFPAGMRCLVPIQEE